MNPKFIILALVALLAGCASPHLKVAGVADTLQNYHVGKTTFADFKRDAGLIMTEQPAPAIRAHRSYLNPQRVLPNLPKAHTVYGISKGSPWKIYETSESVSFINGKFSSTRKFVVGDLNRPISILTFDGQDGLTSISPVP